MSSSTSTTRKTVAGAFEEIAQVRADVKEIKGSLTLILDHLKEGSTTPSKAGKGSKGSKAGRAAKKAVAPVRRAVAHRTPSRVAVKDGTVAGHRCLVRKNREQFIADHDWAERGMSYLTLLGAVVVHGQPLTGNWAIGPKNVERLGGGDRALVAGKKGNKAAKGGLTLVKGGKAVAAKVTRTEQAATVRAPSRGPSNAKGHNTPKREWALREQLAETGKYDRHEIDAKVAAAMAIIG